MNEKKEKLKEDTSQYMRVDNIESSKLEQQIQEYEKTVEQVKTMTYIEESSNNSETNLNEDEVEEELPVQSKIHKKRIAVVGSLLAILITGSVLYQYVVARGMLEFPIYYLNNDQAMMVHEKSGTAKSYTDVQKNYELFEELPVMNPDKAASAKVTKDGRYSLYPENISVEYDGPIYQLMARKMGGSKGQVIGENVLYYEEVSNNVIAIYHAGEQLREVEVYDLEKGEKIEVGSGKGRVVRYMRSDSEQKMVWLEMCQDGTFGLYHQKLDQSEDLVCVVEGMSEYGGVAFSNSLEYMYYIDNEELYMVKQFGAAQKIAEHMSMDISNMVGEHGELYLVKNKENAVDPFLYIDMDVVLSEWLVQDIKNTEYYYPSGELYYYTPAEGMTLVDGNYSDIWSYITEQDNEISMLLYRTTKQQEFEKIMASSIASAYDIDNWIRDQRSANSAQSVCYKGKVILEDKNIVSIKTDLENDFIYYTEFPKGEYYSQFMNETVLKKMNLNDEGAEEVTVDSNVGKVIGTIDHEPYYLKQNSELDEWYECDVYYKGAVVMENVLFSSLYYDQKNYCFYGIRDYNESQETGTLMKVEQDGSETVVMEEVNAYAVLDDQRMLVITKDKYQDQKMYLYQNGKMKQLDQGKFRVLSRLEHSWYAEWNYINLMN